jgi:hypothetical protein
VTEEVAVENELADKPVGVGGEDRVDESPEVRAGKRI